MSKTIQITKLSKIADIKLSNIDKKILDGEEIVNLCNFVDVYYNWAISKSMNIQFIKSSAKKLKINDFKLKKGQVAITKDSETKYDIGIPSYIADNFNNTLLGYHCALITPNSNILCGKYLTCFLNSSYAKKYFEFNASGSGQRYSLSKSIINNIPVILPKIIYQKNIGMLFSKIDQKIQNNKKIILELESMAKTLYDYWFTQFDFPDENGKPYKSSGGKMVYNDELKREIPLGWEAQPMTKNRLLTVLKPGVEVFDKKEYLATAEVNGTNISRGSIIEYATRESRANMQPKVNTVWFAKMKNSTKHLFLNKEMQDMIDNIVLSTGFCGLQCNEKSFEFISSFIANAYFETIKNVLAHGATQEAVNNDDLGSIFMAIPNENVLNKYHVLAKGLFAKKSKLMIENQQLTELRDWLLPMLMNGQAVVE